MGDLLCVSKSCLSDLRLQGFRPLSDVPKVAEPAACAAPGKQLPALGTVSQPGCGCVNAWTTHQTSPLVLLSLGDSHCLAQSCVSGVSTCYMYGSTPLHGRAELLQKWEIGWCARVKAASASCKCLFSIWTRLHFSLHYVKTESDVNSLRKWTR